jgi:uncharacterized protein YaiL (DUF2058 family)
MEIIMAETMFSKESAKRQKEESKKHADVGHAEAVQAEKKINVNFSLAPASKDKMHAKAKEMGISASSLLQLWINEHC